ncbi:MAG: acetyl-CoA acetyltransferase, partial [Rhizobiales bacterium TMED28]
MYQDTDTVIVAASRTAIGSFNGSFRDVAPYKLGSAVIKSLLDKIKIKASDIDEVILGQILTAGQGQNPARQAAIDAGIPFETPAWLINQLCASGLRSVIIAHQQIKENIGRILIAGGQESMTQAPHVSYIRQGQKMGALQMQDTMISDALIDFFNNYHMGVTAENVADKWSISRDEQDQFAFGSQMKAAKAQDAGKFIAEICPVNIERKKNREIVLEDEYIRKNISIDDISSLNTIFKKEGGTVTAANASGINDGAAAVTLMTKQEAERRKINSLVSIKSWASCGVDPALMGTGPIPSSKKALDLAGWTVKDVDLFEINEAFAAQ